MDNEGDAINVKPSREFFREVQVVRLHQPDIEMLIGGARRRKIGAIFGFIA